MNKKFLCFWGESFFNVQDKAKMEEHGMDFFNEGNGYDPEDIRLINNQAIGSAWHSSDYFDHCVVRIE